MSDVLDKWAIGRGYIAQLAGEMQKDLEAAISDADPAALDKVRDQFESLVYELDLALKELKDEIADSALREVRDATVQ